MTVEIRSLFGDRPVPKAEFEAAVAYLKSRGATFQGTAKVWVLDAAALLPDVEEGFSIANLLQTKSIQIVIEHPGEHEVIWTPVGGWERADQIWWQESRLATAQAAAARKAGA